MIILVRSTLSADSPEVHRVLERAAHYENLSVSVYSPKGRHEPVEVHLSGETEQVPDDAFSNLPHVVGVVRASDKYRLIGKHAGQMDAFGFDYRGLHFGQDSFHIFAGLCAVDSRESVDETFRALAANGLRTARMGAYKPRTSPYDFQGLGSECLPYVFELAGKHGIAVVAVEITCEGHLDEVREGLRRSGDPTGVMLQIGTRNAQNFELLKVVGRQREFPVLFKRGMGITLDESLNACEYIASEGNRDIVFCLRGVKSHLGHPHRNLIDFAHVPVVQRLTRLPVCVDPSHSSGSRRIAADGLTEVHHAAAEGVILGANMVLVDFHPSPSRAVCDGAQALTLEELPAFVDDVGIVREAYARRVERASTKPEEWDRSGRPRSARVAA
jgi:3-deoxy-7-phosphoheptulonate synthase